ncbi:hypothetical protein TIFTF001_051156, partial [Ficus carica]
MASITGDVPPRTRDDLRRRRARSRDDAPPRTRDGLRPRRRQISRRRSPPNSWWPATTAMPNLAKMASSSSCPWPSIVLHERGSSDGVPRALASCPRPDLAGQDLPQTK